MGFYDGMTLSLGQVEDIIKEAQCVNCRRHTLKVQMYPHDGGINLVTLGVNQKWWVYGHCTECGHDSALWKLIKQLESR